MRKNFILQISMLLILFMLGSLSFVSAEKTDESAESGGVAVGGRFEGMTVWYDIVATEGDPLATVIYSGAKAAADDFGIELVAYFSNYNPETMLENFKKAVAANPDGIVANGIPGQDAFRPLIEDALEKGIAITLFAVDLPDIRSDYKDKGIGFAGSDLYDAGYTLGKRCVNKWNLGEGDRVMVWGHLHREVLGLRTQGSIDALKEANVTVDSINISDEVSADAAMGIPTFVSYYTSNPDVDLVIFDHGVMTSTVKTYLDAAGLKPGELKTAGYDLSAATADAIKSGYLGLTFDQQFFYQSYLSVLQVLLTKKYGFGGVYSNTGSGFVEDTNIDILYPLIKEGIR